MSDERYRQLPGKSRRFIDTKTGEEISRREHIKRTEHVTPETKAYNRYIAGKAPAGKTVKKVIQKRQEGRPEEPKRKPATYQDTLDTKLMMPDKPRRGYYQLSGRYIFRHEVSGAIRRANGYSYATRYRPNRGSANYAALHAQAIENAIATIEGQYGYLYEGTEWEQWLEW